MNDAAREECHVRDFPISGPLPGGARPLSHRRYRSATRSCHPQRHVAYALLALPAAGDAASHRREGTTLYGIVQGFELEGLVHPAQGVQDACTLGTVFAVIAVTYDDFAERFQVLAEVGATAVVLEADYLACLADLGGLDADQHVPYQALLVSHPWLRVQVEDADSRELLALGRLIIVAHELVATAHPEDHAAILNDSPQIRALGAREVFCEQRLFPVLAAAEEEEVAAGRPYPLREANVDDLHGNAAPLAALLDGDDVSSVAVEVHHVGVKVVDGEPDPSHGITPFVFVAPP